MSPDRDCAPLWRWIREREAIRARREFGTAPPWTTDPILAAYRFCNVRREDDRVTRWVRQRVRIPFAGSLYLWFMLCICRMINWPDTLEELVATDGAWPIDEHFDPRAVADVLRDRARRGEKVYTGAYLIPAPRVLGADKHGHVAEVVLGDLWRRRAEFHEVDHRWSLSATLQGTHAKIARSAGWGDFLAYQAVVDMRFTDLLSSARDVGSWAAAGPGTVRGLNRLHGRPVDRALPQDRALVEMRAIYELAERETGVALDLSDVPNVLCETDKYLRVQRGEGRPRARYVLGRGS